MADQFEVLNTYPQKEKSGGMAEVFSDKLLVRYKGSDIKEPTVCAPAIFQELERIKNFEVHDDDVFLCGFPRSGTTLTQEMVWLILHDFDFDTAEKVDAYNRAQWFDYQVVLHTFQGVEADNFEKLDRPRVFKTHYPVQLLPPQVWTKNPKLIFIQRDIKDCIVSCYYMRKTVMHESMGTMEEHFEDFINDQVFFGPYREYLKNFSALNGKSNILFLTYEGVLADWEGSIRKVAEFLGKEASDENVQKLKKHLDFKNMKKNPKTNMEKYMKLFNQLAGHNEPTDTFIRKGKVGGYKEEMTDEWAKKLDDWMAVGPPKY